MSNTQTIIKGDDTYFNGIDLLGAIKLNTDLDLTGWKATLTYQNETLNFNDLSQKSIQPRFNAKQTSNFKKGAYYATLVLYDDKGYKKTQFTDLPYVVTTEVNRDGY